jgi:hypothetical protein
MLRRLKNPDSQHAQTDSNPVHPQKPNQQKKGLSADQRAAVADAALEWAAPYDLVLGYEHLPADAVLKVRAGLWRWWLWWLWWWLSCFFMRSAWFTRPHPHCLHK